MTTFELALRATAFTQLLFLAIALLLKARAVRALTYAAVLPLGLATFMITSAPLRTGTLGPLALPLTAFCVANPVWFWIFAKAWFDDDFRPGIVDGIALAGMVVVGLAHEVGSGGAPAPWLDGVFKAAILGFVGLAVAHVYTARRADLIESRRRARVAFVAAVGAYATVGIVLQFVYGHWLPRWIVEANIALILVVAFALSLALANVPIERLRDSAFADLLRVEGAHEIAAPAASEHGAPGEATIAWARPRTAPVESLSPPTHVPTHRPVRPVDPDLVTRIRAAMEIERLYRDETITVAQLAEAVGSQEYLVRRAINGTLGYRNFNDFLHHYRLDEADARLRSQPHLPVLTIALDVGFGSIGPFNRAFRARHACTPTEFRASAHPRTDATQRYPAHDIA